MAAEDSFGSQIPSARSAPEKQIGVFPVEDIGLPWSRVCPPGSLPWGISVVSSRAREACPRGNSAPPHGGKVNFAVGQDMFPGSGPGERHRTSCSRVVPFGLKPGTLLF